MSVTVAQAIAATRELMDATDSARWTDAVITTALGIVSGREWSGILNANPYYRFAQRSVTTASDGTLAYTSLNSGSADSAQTWNRILAITDGNLVVYQQRNFMDVPLASTTNQAYAQYDRYWYDAGSNLQIIPTGATALTVTVNWTPPRVDQLSATSVTIDFPDGSEAILELEAAAFLLSKGAAENDAAQTMRAMAEQERQNLYSNIIRRQAGPLSMGFPDRASNWAS